ncbi:Carbonic anhydrase family protein [Trichomonas vaginalis G3]|uniref:Carbonic anhydrase n=1 Tax=Trichomonas vaginalis (strain ATCC PRA-98 / G3) TaxID=412133 RepID=A2ENQ8_TRIV3|nr:reversible hydration of carbon dioxide [Trichomonas vaginalis G3]EAY05684.1 Carbonic anhydrase family protein [Trichomonas vaginalis G3]KAI5506854.1 reversible hydration of carbon dioxide [Trichomonas vaginalis G3]6Y04_A Chain A, Carbonic anhydrase [Trichomonas vaginalis]6Y04_B Chain B, Carbonic anhydrase [Trichomonas vaginalis]|eukprot:XP_001317907.1 Carbonic anhydrase family protein [Trichomonas vaginalis G3]
MSQLELITSANQAFLEANPELTKLNKAPQRHIAIVTCMDTRLVNFAEDAIGVKRGEATVIKAAGNGIWTTGLSDIVVSLLVSIYELGVQEIFIMGHECCGMTHASTDSLGAQMLKSGIKPEDIEKFKSDLSKWVDDFKDPIDNIKNSVRCVRENPLIPKNIPIHGLLIHPDTGKVTTIINGY